MLKIGIVTTQDALNNGAILQGYAHQAYLTGLGYDVEFINYRRTKKFVLRDFIAKNPITMWNRWVDLYNAFKYEKKGDFGDLLTRGSKVYYSIEDLRNDPPKYDVYLAGSDQIWNVLNGSINPVYYLDFGDEKVKRISSAASMGQGIVPESMEDVIREKLKKFNAISLREAKTANFVQSLLGNSKKVYHLPDPTFLLQANDYIKLFENKKIEEKPFVVSYMLHEMEPDQVRTLQYILKKRNHKLINLRNPDTGIRIPGAKSLIVKPVEWLNYMYNAEFTLCCSFHAVVFSLIFQKPFVVISPRPNERISSLLSIVGLQDRIIIKYDEAQIDSVLNSTIDWDYVDEKLAVERQKSVDYLNRSLKVD